MKLVMFLNVIDGTKGHMWTAPSRLWRREVETDWVPAPGERVVLWVHEGEPSWDGPMWEVRERYMCHDGEWHVDLTGMVVDAQHEGDRQEMQRMVVMGGPRRYAPWWTGSGDGDPEPKLQAGGWSL